MSASAHTYALKPSDASKLGEADIFFRMSDTMEPFTGKLVKSLPKRVQVVTLQDTRGLKLYPRRDRRHLRGRARSRPRRRSRSQPRSDGRPRLARSRQRQDHGGPHRPGAGRQGAGQTPPCSAPTPTACKAKLDALSTELAADLAPIAGKPYIVFHDALQYFERRYRLRVVGSIAISPEVAPSAKRLSTLRKRIASLGALCAFAEPQFDTRLIDTVIEGTKARTGSIDPEGARIEPGPELYFTLLRNLARDLKTCLAPPA